MIKTTLFKTALIKTTPYARRILLAATAGQVPLHADAPPPAPASL